MTICQDFYSAESCLRSPRLSSRMCTVAHGSCSRTLGVHPAQATLDRRAPRHRHGRWGIGHGVQDFRGMFASPEVRLHICELRKEPAAKPGRREERKRSSLPRRTTDVVAPRPRKALVSCALALACLCDLLRSNLKEFWQKEKDEKQRSFDNFRRVQQAT